MSQTITTLSQFLTGLGVDTRFYDLGRRISRLSPECFQEVEEGRIAYPTPYLHQAWLGLVISTPTAPQAPMIWFLRFPLDEQGMLRLAERDHFLKTLLTAVGANLEAARAGRQLEAVLEGNPYVFTPPPERQAAFHAHVKISLQLPPSQFYDTAHYYLETAVHKPDEVALWQAVGLQGLADFAVRWNRDNHHGALISAIPALPLQPFSCLCECLENEPVDAKVAVALYGRLTQLLRDQSDADPKEDNARAIAAALRGLSNSVSTDVRQRAIAELLRSNATQIPDVMVALATRCGDDLIAAPLTLPFLEALATFPQDTFNRVMADLLYQPHLRRAFLSAFRQPHRSETLAQAIGGLLQP